MKIDVEPDEIMQAFTTPCPNSPENEGHWDGNKGEWVEPDPTCFIYQRCGKCFDGVVLSEHGKKLAKMIRAFDGGING